MKLLKNTRFLVAILLVLGISIPVLAQNEIERERSSLKGIAEMGFTVNIEANVSLNEKGELEITSIK